MKENKRERFERLATARTNKIIDMVKLLGNCSNIGAYEYGKADVDKIFSAIEKAVKDAHAKYSAALDKNSSKFTL